MKSNRIILLFIFFGIGYVLYFKDKPGPIAKVWHTISSIFNRKPKTEEPNPYKAPEPTDREASADNSATASTNLPQTNPQTQKADDEISLLEKWKDKVLGNETKNQSAEVIELPDFALPTINKSDEIIKHKNFTLRYSEANEIPMWVVHKLRGEFTKGRASRGELQFMPDRKVKNSSALSGDYSSSGYDRGHMVPAGDFKCCQELMTETFYMSNICPQVPDFNRGIWENIESRIRGWAVRDEELFIVTGPLIQKNLPKIGRYNRVSVPAFFYKIVLFYQPDSGKKARAIAFLLPNEPLIGKRMNNYVVPIDQIEAATGLDFFAKLPNDIEDRIEGNSDWEAWTKIQ